MFRWRILILLVVPLAGCDAPTPELDSPQLPTATGTQFDSTNVGTIVGRVTWDGPIPSFPLLTVPAFLPKGVEFRKYSYPNSPEIDPVARGVREAVVYLEGIDYSRAKPWNHDPVGIEIFEDRIAVVQGNSESRIGFVRRGDAIEMMSKGAGLQVLSARGAAFFGLAFPDPDRPLRRTLNQSGLVDLSSAAGKYWQRAYLFVADHPYYTLADSDGDFRLEDIPPGKYLLKCWLPNPTVERNERDPNTGLVLRFVHAPPIEWTQTVQVEAGSKISVAVKLAK